MTGGPDKEHGTNKSPPTGRIQERSEKHAMCPTSLPESSLLASILAEWCGATRKDPESGWSARDSPETNPITTKPEAASHVAEQSWVPLASFSPPGAPFQQSPVWSALVSPPAIHFWVSDKSPFLGPGRGLHSCSMTVSDSLIAGESAWCQAGNGCILTICKV